MNGANMAVLSVEVMNQISATLTTVAASVSNDGGRLSQATVSRSYQWHTLNNDYLTGPYPLRSKSVVQVDK